MREQLEQDTAFIGKKWTLLDLGIMSSLNAITFVWFFLFSNF